MSQFYGIWTINHQTPFEKITVSYKRQSVDVSFSLSSNWFVGKFYNSSVFLFFFYFIFFFLFFFFNYKFKKKKKKKKGNNRRSIREKRHTEFTSGSVLNSHVHHCELDLMITLYSLTYLFRIKYKYQLVW
jgi:uncharacterized membrane protein